MAWKRSKIANVTTFAMVCGVGMALSTVCSAQDAMTESERPTWRIQLANDAFLRSDNQFTNGIAVQKHSAVRDSLDDTSGTPAFGKSLARHLLSQRPELFYRESWSIGQAMQTPDAKERVELITDDVPYVGMLGIANSFVAFNDHELTGFELMLGWVGPRTGASEVQRVIHEIAGSVEPRGWDNQLDDEPFVSFSYTKKRKLWSMDRFDGAWSLDAAVGNLFTLGQAGIEMRFGELPQGFLPLPTPLGQGVAYDGRLPMRDGQRMYGSIALSAARFLVALPRQGNILVDGNDWTQAVGIEPRDSVAQAVLGWHFERQSWAVHLSYWITTNTFEQRVPSGLEERDNSFGAMSFEWRLK